MKENKIEIAGLEITEIKYPELYRQATERAGEVETWITRLSKYFPKEEVLQRLENYLDR